MGDNESFYLKTLNYIDKNPQSIGLTEHDDKFNYEAYKIYDKWMKPIKLTNIDENFNKDFKNTDKIIDKLKNVAQQLFDHISKNNYPTGDNRSNHGILNHMRSLVTGINLYFNR